MAGVSQTQVIFRYLVHMRHYSVVHMLFRNVDVQGVPG